MARVSESIVWAPGRRRNDDEWDRRRRNDWEDQRDRRRHR